MKIQMNRLVLFITLLTLSAQSLATTMAVDSSEGSRTPTAAFSTPMGPS